MKNRLGALLVLLILSCAHSYGQDVTEWYKKLPAELVDLDSLQLAILLEEGKYLDEGEDTTIFILEEVNEEKDYLLISWAYLNSIPAWTAYEARLFQSDDRKVLVVSVCSGVRVQHFQREFRVYEVEDENTLSELDYNLKIDKTEFFVANTPSKYLMDDSYFFCFTYNLQPETYPDGFAYTAGPCYILEPSIERYQVRNDIRFQWTGNGFERK